MQDMPLFVSLLLFGLLGLDLDLDAIMWLQSDVVPLLTGLQMFESDRQGTGASHFLLM
jgi:hypothetical protein